MSKFCRFENRGGLVAILDIGLEEEWAFDEANLRTRIRNLSAQEPPGDTSVESATLAEMVRKQAVATTESEER